MFRKLKDKIAEEVKSSPQRLQQFAQAAQAAVTSASSSISDISNNDLFSIADDGADTPQNSPGNKTKNLTPAGFQDVLLSHTPSPLHSNSSNDKQETGDTLAPLISNHYGNTKSNLENLENGPGNTNLGIYPPLYGGNRTRKLSNSSTASDVSFRLPSYESPGSMFHLQSDLDVSASEMEDNISVPAQLERVSKEHLYAAYRKTNEKYNKYRGRYTDLARHYKSLERENAKAKAVLVETQDKALRRISELREQCQLEQSAKAHLENALRLELDERNLKIESLNTKIKLLQSYSTGVTDTNATPLVENSSNVEEKEDVEKNIIVSELVNIDEKSKAVDDLNKNNDQETIQNQLEEMQSKHSLEIQNFNTKLQKLEQLLAKCKETIKTHKDKNSQLSNEIQIVSNQLDKKNSENEQLSNKIIELTKVTSQLDESKEQISKLQNELDTFEQKKQLEVLTVKADLITANSEISNLKSKIEILNQREEENVISLAENKLSIHKELEGKENEIKSLSEKLSKLNAEVKANEIVNADLKHKLKDLEEEKSRFKEQLASFDETKEHISNLEGKIKEFRKKNQEFESKYSSLIENFKCTELQLKQESDEKLATIDRNNFLESRNKQLSDENSVKSKCILDIEKEMADLRKNIIENNDLCKEHQLLLDEQKTLKSNYDQVVITKETLENEINVINDKLNGLTEICEKLRTENAELIKNIQKYDDEIKQLRKSETETNERNELFQKEYELLKEKYSKEESEFNKKIEQLKTELKNSNSGTELKEQESLKKLEEDLQKQLQESNRKLENEYQNILVEYNALKEQYKELNKKCDSYVSENNLSLQQIKNLEEYSLKLTNEKQLSDGQAQAFETKLNLLEKEHEELMLIKENMEQKLTSLENENQDVKSKLNNNIDDINSLQNELSQVRDLHTQMISEKEKIEEKILQMERFSTDKNEESNTALNAKCAENESLNTKINELNSVNEKLIGEKHELSKQLEEKNKNIKEIEIKLKEYSENNEVWQLKLSNILDDNNSLQEKCGKFKFEKDMINEKVSNLEQKLSEYETVKVQFEEAKLEKEFLNMRISQLDADVKQIHGEKNQLNADNESLKRELSKTINSSQEKVRNLEENINKCKNELLNVSTEKSKLEGLLNVQKKEKENLVSTVQNFTDKTNEYEKLQEDKKVLENKIGEIMSSLTNLRYSSEKEIEKLKQDLSSLQQTNELLESKCSELNELSKKYDDLKTDSDRVNVKIRVLEQVEIEHLETIEKMHLLKDENVKLQADIEGLQTHLTKMSKNNSELNDKIRELLANDELIQAKHQQNLQSTPSGEPTGSSSLDQAALESQLKKLTEMNSQLLEQLKASENLSNHISDLERQNSILVEEKLELEDQLKSSMDTHDNFDNLNKTKNSIQEDILKEKMELESQLAQLELINRSNDNNMKVLEQKNEKLKLSNEKLERRLDETLVSLNHIRTMEENTELEYLRNILYEYLTGPTNNNMVLAKVLSAVVKFDHRQTQLVLEREKERQGVLGQLGLL